VSLAGCVAGSGDNITWTLSNLDAGHRSGGKLRADAHRVRLGHHRRRGAGALRPRHALVEDEHDQRTAGSDVIKLVRTGRGNIYDGLLNNNTATADYSVDISG
jgi:hypothetical protein